MKMSIFTVNFQFLNGKTNFRFQNNNLEFKYQLFNQISFLNLNKKFQNLNNNFWIQKKNTYNAYLMYIQGINYIFSSHCLCRQDLTGLVGAIALTCDQKLNKQCKLKMNAKRHEY